jgi:hypothetical protein
MARWGEAKGRLGGQVFGPTARSCQRKLNTDQLAAARWSVFSCRRQLGPWSKERYVY